MARKVTGLMETSRWENSCFRQHTLLNLLFKELEKTVAVGLIIAKVKGSDRARKYFLSGSWERSSLEDDWIQGADLELCKNQLEKSEAAFEGSEKCDFELESMKLSRWVMMRRRRGYWNCQNSNQCLLWIIFSKWGRKRRTCRRRRVTRSCKKFT